MTNQEKRNLLRRMRRQLAELNDIVWLSSGSDCQDGCAGDCPLCRAELRYLESELNRRAAESKAIVLLGEDEEEPAAAAAPAVPQAEVVAPVREPADSFWEMSTEEVGLSLRTRVTLEGAEVTTLRQLLQLSPSELKQIRNMTQEGLEEIEYQLGLLGLNMEKDL